MLDKRLKKIADLVTGGTAYDVGTDHAQLAAELILSGKCEKVIASDIKEGPLASARKTLEKYGVTDKVGLVLSDGLHDVEIDTEKDCTVIIAGMGGETIIHILEDLAERVEINSRFSFILQPMTKTELLRKWLSEHGLNDKNEYIVEESGKTYVIMNVRPFGEYLKLSEAECLTGGISRNTDEGVRYLDSLAERLQKTSESLLSGGKYNASVHYHALSCKVKNHDTKNNSKVKVNEIYEYLNTVYPFDTQEKWDNSGYLVRHGGNVDVSKVLLTLDIDKKVISEAVCRNKHRDKQLTDILIISHHPVIFSPLRILDADSPAGMLMKNNIPAVCMHTNVDKCARGTNWVILRKLRENFNIRQETEELDDNFGYIATLEEPEKVTDIARKVKEIFGCEYVRGSRCISDDTTAQRIAFCSGSGGSMLDEVIAKGCDLYITGDVKHDVWISSNNVELPILDCGHFHTENIVLEEICCVLEEKFPQLDIEIAENSIDPCIYF